MIPDLDPCQMITHPYKEGLKFVLINLGPTHVKFSFICHFDPKGLNRYSIVSFPEITNLNPENICFCLCYFLWSHSQGRDFIMLFDFLFCDLIWCVICDSGLFSFSWDNKSWQWIDIPCESQRVWNWFRELKLERRWRTLLRKAVCT